MRTILASLDSRSSRHSSLARELRDCDARQLLDMGMVRAEDGSLRLASDPAVLAVPPARKTADAPWRPFRLAAVAKALARVVAGLLRPSKALKTAL